MFKMELVKVDRHLVTGEQSSTELPFIVANTSPMNMFELEHEHIIPVFVKDNEPVISHQDFINCVQEVSGQVFPHETILKPSIRVSHPIKGRIPEAKDKPAKELLEHEKPSTMREWPLCWKYPLSVLLLTAISSI